MLNLLSALNSTPQRQAHIYATGFLVILTLGTLAAIAACLIAIWAVVQFATLLLTSIIESCTMVGQMYASADPLVKFLILVAIGFLIYQAGRRFLRRA